MKRKIISILVNIISAVAGFAFWGGLCYLMYLINTNPAKIPNIVIWFFAGFGYIILAVFGIIGVVAAIYICVGFGSAILSIIFYPIKPLRKFFMNLFNN